MTASTKDYTCYACGSTNVQRSDLRYECMCEDRFGVCKTCERVPLAQFHTRIPAGHSMSKIHDLTPEYAEFDRLVTERCGRWSGCSFGTNEHGQNTMTVSYLEGPGGEKDDELNAYTLRTHGFESCYLAVELRDLYRKSATFVVPERTCTCCQRPA
jgi:hypothetical protein